ncbi:ATP synthase subunit a [Planctomycetales bacterium]|nr:ATP synthase subunit a [Planctomycetales bacterium]
MKKILPLMLAFATVAPAVAAEDPMDAPIPVYMWGLEFSHTPIFYAGVCALILVAVCYWWSRGLSKEKPGRGQVFLEMLIRQFDTLTTDGFGTKKRGRVYLAWLTTLFMFIWACNMTGLFPIPAWHIGNFPVPSPAEPTANVNTTIGLALLFVFLIGHGSSIYYQGFVGYLKEAYLSPGGAIGWAMSGLNVVSKVAEVVSISFRLFGNIFGGSVIIAVVSSLVYYLVLPIGLFGFFGIFVGTIQAFVFTMLALTYIASGATEVSENKDESEAA